MGTLGEEEIYIDLIHFPVLTLGMGKRIGIWFRGCSLRCDGCIAAHAWERDEACRTTAGAVLREVLDHAGPSRYGITISGGEPFDQHEALFGLLTLLRKSGFEDIMVYSGYEFARLKAAYPGTLALIDALVDGRFTKGQPTDSHWKGSDNQNMILLTENANLKMKYLVYRNSRKSRTLQVIEKGTKVYIIGIPEQKDSEVIKNGFS
jgi:anaerobic ribonucleoside-triphosphate reductase activating protein